MIGLFWSCSDRKTTPVIEKHFAKSTRQSPDSVAFPRLITPFRWYAADGQMVILDLKTDPMVHVLALPDLEPLTAFGRQGKGPGEYLMPGLIEKMEPGRIALYETNPNKVQYYVLDADTVYAETTTKFPLWTPDMPIAKAFSSVWAVNDSLAIGLSFPPDFPEADLVNLASGENVASLEFVSNPSDEDREDAYLYLCQGDYSDGYFAVGYNYIDRIEIYRLDSAGFAPVYVIGSPLAAEQTKRFESGRDDEMIFYYSGVVIDNGKLYALRQQIPEKDRADARTVLEIYDLKTGRGLQQAELGRLIDRCMIDAATNKLYGYDPFAEASQLYVYALDQ